jgi:peptide chain release factor subunit 1
MRSELFQRLLEARGPFASVYFDDSHNMTNPAADLDVRWRDVRRGLERQGAEPALVSAVEHAVLGARPPVGRSGRCVIATADGALIDERLPWMNPSPVVRVSELPFILPLIAHSAGTHRYLVVAVDHVGADIEVHAGDVRTSETVDPGGYPVHKASRADKREYGEAQQRVDEMFRKNIKAVAERITAIVDDIDAEAVFVVGEVRSRSAAISALPEPIRGRAVSLHAGARHAVFDEQAHAAIDTELARRRRAAADADAERFKAGRSRESGLAVDGLGPVCAALRDGAIDTLMIGDLNDRTVVADSSLRHIAPDADVLSELGAAPTRIMRADEALPLAAVAVDASIVSVGVGIDFVDGVGALLRYRETAETVSD